MENYGDIIGRLSEIIINGQTRKTKGLSNVVVVRGYYIDESEVEEFKQLMAIERTFYSLNTKKDTTKKNDELLKLCEQKLQEFPNNTLYRRLLEILDSAFGKKCSDLAEHSGYYILKENYLEFCDLCYQLKVGPNAILATQDRESSIQIIEESAKEKKLQFLRLQNYIQERYNEQIYRSFLAEDLNTGERNIAFEHVIFMGIYDMLSIDYVVAMRNILSETRFNQMLNVLKACKFFSLEEINKIYTLSHPSEQKSLNIDDLVKFLAKTKELDVASLKVLIPTIGIYEYHYIMDELFKSGVISIDAWLESTKELCSDEPFEGIEDYKKNVDEIFSNGLPR